MQEMTTEDKRYAATAAHCIERAFQWTHTKEGSDYWLSVHQKLLALAQDENPRFI